MVESEKTDPDPKVWEIEFGAKNQSPTPLKNHLKAKHKKEYAEMEETLAAQLLSVANSEQILGATVVKNGREAVNEKFREATVKWIVHSYKPLNVVEDSHFRAMISAVNPNIGCMCSETVNARIVSKAALYRGKLRQFLKGRKVAITIDCWTSNADESYIAFTVHLIHDWNMLALLVECSPFPGTHTAVDCKLKLEEMLEHNAIQKELVTTNNLLGTLLVWTEWHGWRGGTVFAETPTVGPRNIRVGIPKIALRAAFLDPRTKSLHGVPKNDKRATINSVFAEMLAEYLKSHPNPVTTAVTQDVNDVDGVGSVSEDADEHAADDDDADDHRDDGDGMDIFTEIGLRDDSDEEEIALAVPTILSPEAHCWNEIAAYQKIPALCMKIKVSEKEIFNDPLSWYRDNEDEFPLLSAVAKRTLNIPATSASSERLFSSAGLTVTSKRTALKAETVNELTK